MVFEKDVKLVDAITRNVLDAYYYGTKDYTGAIHMSECINKDYDVDITFMNCKVEIYVSYRDYHESITLPYGKHGQTELITMIQTTIDVLTFMVQGNW
jgi:hypothetical protein